MGPNPNTEPWETSVNTVPRSEHGPLMTTFCVRPDSQALIHEDIISDTIILQLIR